MEEITAIIRDKLDIKLEPGETKKLVFNEGNYLINVPEGAVATVMIKMLDDEPI
jgi:hypothetical protein